MPIMNWLTGISVVETDNLITIKGIDGRRFSKLISSVFNTSKLSSNMIHRASFKDLSFPKFFLIDIVYLFNKLVEVRNDKKIHYMVRNNIPYRQYMEVVELLKKDTWLRDVENENYPNKLDFSKLNLFVYKPKDYQQEFFDYYNTVPNRYHLKGALLNGAPGMGKSYAATATMEMTGVDKIIVICPKATLQKVWVDDPNNFYKKPPKIWTSQELGKPEENNKMFVYHYEALERCLEDIKPLFSKYSFGIILDECHNLNDVNSQRTQRYLELCKLSNSNNIIHMSGTPFKAIGAESIPLLRAIDESFKKDAEEKYRKIYGADAKKGLEILKHRLGLMSFVVEKHRLGLEPPEITTVGIQIPNSKQFTLPVIKEKMKKFIEERVEYYKQREDSDKAFFNWCCQIYRDKKGPSTEVKLKRYLDIVKMIQRSTSYYELKEEIKYAKDFEKNEIEPTLPKENIKEFRNVVSIIKYLVLKIQGECLGTVVGRARIDAHIAMCDNIPFKDICLSSIKKTLVFTSFVDVLEKAKDTCIKQGLNPILVYGKTNKDLAGMVGSFAKDKTINPLIATYDSLSTGVPMTMADTMIMINAPFRTYIQEQAISRIHRLNQDSQTRVFQLYLDTGEEKNISSRSLDIMKWSQEQVEMITGIKSPYTITDDNNGTIQVSSESFEDLSLEVENLYKENFIVQSTRPNRAVW